MRKIKKGDQVVVISGRDKGREGEVLKVLDRRHKPSSSDLDLRLIVKGINMVIKHVKPNPQLNIEGGRKEQEAAITYSNVAILNPETGKKDRVGIRLLEDGKKVRYFKSNGEVIDV